MGLMSAAVAAQIARESAQPDLVSEDGSAIDLKTRYRDVFDIMADEVRRPRKGNDERKLTKAEKKRLKKLRTRMNVAIQTGRRIHELHAKLLANESNAGPTAGTMDAPQTPATPSAQVE
jgi:predicted transglutaminase-like cysteine proteinase